MRSKAVAERLFNQSETLVALLWQLQIYRANTFAHVQDVWMICRKDFFSNLQRFPVESLSCGTLLHLVIQLAEIIVGGSQRRMILRDQLPFQISAIWCKLRRRSGTCPCSHRAIRCCYRKWPRKNDLEKELFV